MVRLLPMNAAPLVPPRDVDVLQPRSREFGAGLDRALATAATWRHSGSLQEPATGWWAQRIRDHDTDVVGLLAVIDATATGDDRLLPHEQVFQEPVERRVRLRRELRLEPRPSLVLLREPPDHAVVSALREAFTGSEPALRDSAGRMQAACRLPDDVGREVASALVGVPALLADGHHRVAAATHPAALDPGTSFAFVVPPGQGRSLWPVHRVLLRLSVDDPVAGARAAGFELVEAGNGRGGAGGLEAPSADDPPVLLTATGALRVTSGPPGWDDDLPALTRGLPVSLAHALATALGAGDRRTDLGTAHDLDQVVGALDGGARAAILVGGPTLEQVWDAARNGVRLPPKATSFHPKPLGGFVVRLVDGDGSTGASIQGGNDG